MIVLWTAFMCPVVLTFMGAWLETLGPIEGLADAFFTRAPLGAIGCVVGALTAMHA